MTEDREYWEHHFKEQAEVTTFAWKFIGLMSTAAAATVFMFWVLFLSGWAQ